MGVDATLCRWWQAWCAFSGFSVDRQGNQAYVNSTAAGKSRPGPIQNDVLIDPKAPSTAVCSLRRDLKEGQTEL